MEFIIIFIVLGWIIRLLESAERKALREKYQKKLSENPDMVDTLIG